MKKLILLNVLLAVTVAQAETITGGFGLILGDKQEANAIATEQFNKRYEH